MVKLTDIPSEAPFKALSSRQVARLLGVSRSFVYDEIKAGRLPHVRIGQRRIVIEQRELDRYLRLRRLDAETAAARWQERPRGETTP